MAAIAIPLTSGGSTSANSFATASISPTANRLVLLIVGSSINSNDPNTPTASGAGLTWTEVTTTNKTVPAKQRITAFRALSSSPGSGAVTIDFAGQSQETACWAIAEFAGAVTTGSNGSGAIIQGATGLLSSGTTSFMLNLSALAKATNTSYGAMQNIGLTSSITAGVGYTEIAEVNNNGMNFEQQYNPAGQTTLDWYFNASDGGLGIALEIAADDTGGSFLFNMI